MAGLFDNRKRIMPNDMSPAPGLTVSVGSYSAAGRKRVNQDFHGAMLPEGRSLRLKGIVLAVADGISTSPVSREAAETCVKALLTDYYCTTDSWTAKTAASRVMTATNSWLHAQSRRAHLESIDLGWVCTLSAMILKHRTAHLFHVGDSRISRLSGESLEPLTREHHLTLSEGEFCLSRAMGAAADLEIDYHTVDLEIGDTFLLTTDGIHDHVPARAIAAALRGAPDLDAAAQAIAEEATALGSPDNLTIQIVRIDGLPENALDVPSVEGGHLIPPPLPETGAEIDGYKILRSIHASHRSHIFLAAAPDGSRVALKIPSMDMREDPAYLRRFLMEEWVARRLANPHIVAAVPAPEAKSALYTVSEFVEGRTLRQWMVDNPNPDLDLVRDIVRQITQGLRAFHRQEMLHQDLRPENVMIDGDGTVKIIDLGSTYIAGVDEAEPEQRDILGTLQYAAPEYFNGDPVTWSADLFSLGVITYEMLTGRLPYGTAVSKVRSRRDLGRLAYRSACDEKNGVPDWMDDALRRAVHPYPEQRQQALSEFDLELRQPGTGWRARKRRPFAERDPVRFWKIVSLILAILVVLLLVRDAGAL